MSDFVNDWVRCNSCFQNFDKGGGMMTSCGHFLCNRAKCKVECSAGEKITCPICKAACTAISLNQTLPEEILQYFEEPDSIITKALDILRFQSQQKILAKKHFDMLQEKLNELQAQVDSLKEENKKLKSSMKNRKGTKDHDITEEKEEDLIPDIIGKQMMSNALKRAQKEGEFSIQTEHNVPEGTQPISQTQKAPPVSKLFTPTLASRLQSLTGKKLYGPV